jgi:hypothetical protein
MTTSPMPLRRVQPEQITHVDTPSVEDFGASSRLQLALDTFSVYRIAGRSWRESLRQFFRVLRGNT